MSNERIELTQFEGISEGKWEHDGGEIYAEEAGRNNSIIAQYPSWNYNVKDNDGLLTVEDASNLMAMAAVPDLIAELKRCYEEIDELKELCHEFLGQALTLYDVGNQHKDVNYDYREFNKLRTRFAELLNLNSASE